MRASTSKGVFQAWRAWGQWVIIPLAIFALTEGMAQAIFDRVPRWYSAALQAAAQGHVDVVFIGSSRVLAAVHAPTFKREVYALTGLCPRTLNLGMGNSSDAEHYLGLRKLFASYPDNLEGVVVFIEAPAGLPSLSRWTGLWTDRYATWMLVDLLRWTDLWPFWRSSGHPVSDKLHLTLRLGARGSSTFNRRERIRENLLTAGVSWLVGLRSGSVPSTPFRFDPDNLVGPDLSYQPDAVFLLKARELALRTTDESLANQVAVRGWETTIQEDLLQLVRRHGGGVVFFDVPLSSVFARLYASPLRQDDIRLFARQAQVWGAPILRPRMEFTDNDMSDLWHLNSSLAPTFSIELARTWVDVLRARGEEPAVGPDFGEADDGMLVPAC